VRGAERVVHEDVGKRGELPGERGIVRLLLLVKAEVLEQDDVARTRLRDRRGDRRPYAVVELSDRAA
jgi:hypothetical protein